jgi:Holliday junction resolvasome RuvABC endonuclease subunit
MILTTIGIDYSLTSPALCVHTGDSWNIRNCQFYFLTDKPKYEGKTYQLNGTLHEEWRCDQERYENISEWAMDIIRQHNPRRIVIEGYSFGSKGQVFNLGENTGLLKYKLFKEKLSFVIIPPTTIKKFAVGKGNANKDLIEERFLQESNIDVRKILGMTAKQYNPSSDVADSYFMAKYAWELEQNGGEFP